MVLHNFIVFEGIDGSGTTTQIQLLKERTLSNNFYFSAEPTNGPTGKFLRQILKGDFTIQEETAAYLFSADRNEHIFGLNGIKDHVDHGEICISDRYFFSTLAYQSISCGFELPILLNSKFPLPEILFFFEIEPEISLSRIQNREYAEIYEKLDFLKKTSQAYNQVMTMYDSSEKGESMKIIRLDATEKKEIIAEKIWNELSHLPIK